MKQHYKSGVNHIGVWARGSFEGLGRLRMLKGQKGDNNSVGGLHLSQQQLGLDRVVRLFGQGR